MKNKQRKKEETKIVKKPKLNKKIDEIIADYPEKIRAYPRGAFEEQLGQHLVNYHYVNEDGFLIHCQSPNGLTSTPRAYQTVPALQKKRIITNI